MEGKFGSTSGRLGILLHAEFPSVPEVEHDWPNVLEVLSSWR